MTLDQVEAGDISANYPGRSYTGGPITSNDYRGLSIRDLISQDVGIPIPSVTFVEITTGSAAPSTLSNADLGDPSNAGYPFANGLLPLIFYYSSSVGYLAPLRNGSQAPNDSQDAAQNAPLFLTIHTTGTLLNPIVESSSTTPHAKSSVSFSARFATAPSTALTYSWRFGDGGVATDAAPTHSYATAGRYLVTVTVNGADGSYGASNVVVETVGKPAPPAGTGTGTGTGKSTNPTSGPQTGSGSRAGGVTGTPSTTSQAIDGTTGTGMTGDGANTSDLPVVTGYVITRQVVKSATGSSRAAEATAPAERAGGVTPLGWGVIAAGVLVLLLGLGALSEVGLPLRRHARKGVK